MNGEILTGLEIAKKDNKEMCALSTINDLEKQIKVDQEAETHRTVFRRERDRILYSGGFRRLQDKTQVIAAVKTGDHRTRLTHSLEVEQIAVSISDALNLNKDLTSAIALGHDIGHTPFGHAVESFLNKKLKNEGGFSHALESIRYLNAKDMDISEEIIEGILKHDTDVFVYKFEKDGQLEAKELYNVNKPPGTLEAQIVYWADKIAYITHDYEDFVKNNLQKKSIENNPEIEKELEVIFSNLLNKKIFKLADYKIKYLIRDLVRGITTNLIESSSNNIIECFDKNTMQSFILKSKKEKQDYIREETFKRIKKDYKTDREYELLEKNDFKNKSDEEIMNETEKLYEMYKSINNEKMIKRIKKIRFDINHKIELKKEIEGMSNLEILKEHKKINRYKELCNAEIDIFKDRLNDIKKKSYLSGLIINLSSDYRESYLKLRKIIDKYYIGSPEVQLSDAKAERIVSLLFDMYNKNIKILPNEIKIKIDKDIEEKINKIEVNHRIENKQERLEVIYRRNIASYIASMSDRYAEQIYMDLNSTGSHYNY